MLVQLPIVAIVPASFDTISKNVFCQFFRYVVQLVHVSSSVCQNCIARICQQIRSLCTYTVVQMVSRYWNINGPVVQTVSQATPKEMYCKFETLQI